MAGHGQPGTYNQGCRCKVCRDAHRKRCARTRASLDERRAASPSDVPHSLSGYINWGCRCDICKDAHREYEIGDWDVSRGGQPWTEDELQLAVREDLRVYVIARRLKRPYQAVVRKRLALRNATPQETSNG